MQCPNCRLENPPIALRCDCGYDFESRQVKDSYLPGGPPKKKHWIVVALRGVAVAVGLYLLWGLVFFAIGKLGH